MSLRSMFLALVLVAFVAGTVGAAAAGAFVGWSAWLGGLPRWWRHGRGGEPLRTLARATPGATTVVEGRVRASGDPAHAVIATAVPDAIRGKQSYFPGPGAVSASAGEVWIETDDGKVLLAAEAIVTCGAIEVGPGCPAATVAARLGELPADLCSIARWSVRCVRPGDLVRATGRLESAPDLDGPADYRSRAVRYRMFAGPSQEGVAEGIQVASTRPPRPFVPRRTRIVAAIAGAVVSAALATVTLQLVVPQGVSPPPSANPALDHVDRLLAQHLFEEAASVADAVGLPDRAARGHFMSGDLRSAAAAFALARDRNPSLEPTWDELDAYIAAREYGKSAALAHLLAEKKPDVAGGLECVASVQRGMGRPDEQLREPTAKGAWKQGLLCELAAASVVTDPKTTSDLREMLNLRNFGFMRPGPPPPPDDLEADTRVAAYLLAERGELGAWPFELPHPAHVLTAYGTVFRMPTPYLDTSVRAREREMPWQEKVERAVMMAVWESFLGDHGRAQQHYRTAMLAAGLEAAAPEDVKSPRGPFQVPRIHSLLGRKSATTPDWSADLFGIGAALALRAGQRDSASAYVDLLPEEKDRTRIRRYVWAASGEDRTAMDHLRDVVRPNERAFLEGAAADLPGLPGTLGDTDAQGLWPVVGRRLSFAVPSVKAWAAGAGPSNCGDCGFHGLLAHWAGRRAAARSIDAFEEEASAGRRIERLRTFFFDRQAIVLLYVTGRLASMR